MNTTPLLLTAGPKIAGLLPANVPARPPVRIVRTEPVLDILHLELNPIHQDWRDLLASTDCNPGVIRIEVEPHTARTLKKSPRLMKDGTPWETWKQQSRERLAVIAQQGLPHIQKMQEWMIKNGRA